MSRPRAFDESTALDAAMTRFWAAGYAGTSVRDLGDAMGLGAASVYNAFGDKRTLFTLCLDRYLDANMRARILRLEQTRPPRAAIETFLTEIVERSLENRLGCLLVNAALEIGPHDAEIAAVIAERMDELEAGRDHEWVVICHHGVRSAMATGFLAANGFSRASNLSGGIDRWSLEVDPGVPRY
jgi:TetR/AcrR family transcriptional repressor of nem operon